MIYAKINRAPRHPPGTTSIRALKKKKKNVIFFSMCSIFIIYYIGTYVLVYRIIKSYNYAYLYPYRCNILTGSRNTIKSRAFGFSVRGRANKHALVI